VLRVHRAPSFSFLARLERHKSGPECNAIAAGDQSTLWSVGMLVAACYESLSPS